jgi:hypothetical protein
VILLYLLMMLPNQIKVEAELPAATAYFEDLNQDGVIDFWLRSDDHRIFVQDGNAADGVPIEIEYEPVNGIRPRPLFYEGTWVAAFMDGDHRVIFRDDRWQPQQRWHTNRPMRHASFIREMGDGKVLVPTMAGFELYQDGCFEQELMIRPTVQLKRSRLNVIYPVIQPMNLDGDGKSDWVGTPIALSDQGKLGIWRMVSDEPGDWQMLEFPPDRTISLYAFGDVDGDGFPELAVMTRPARGFSLFEEMGILIYQGTGPGTWTERATQEIKSKQNLWQTGPITLNEKGLTTYYYKGIFKSKFKMDHYAWSKDGYFKPRVKSEDWKMEKGERLTMILNRDLTGDGHNDLILADNTGLYLYPADANAAIPFAERRRQKICDWPFNVSFGMDVSAGDDLLWFPESDVITEGWLRYRRDLAMVRGQDQSLSFWHVEREDSTGHLIFERHARFPVAENLN